MYYKERQDAYSLKLANVYLSYIEGIQQENGRFKNFKDKNLKLTKQNSETNLDDANGRALWSLGFVIGQIEILPADFVQRAEKCWISALQRINDIKSPRAIAYAIKGLYNYYTVRPEKSIQIQIAQLADNLLNHYNINSDENGCGMKII